MVEQSASAAPDKSLQPPNCSGDKISPPNPQIPNLSSPIVSPSASSMDLPQISALQLGHSQIQMTPSGALVFPTKTPAMSQQQTNLMSPTSNFVMQPSLQRSGPMSPIEQRQQQFGTAMEQSASASPAKSLKPPNCSGDQISPPNHQIPNLSSPIVSPSSTSMDLLQISAPHLQMTPSGILVVPPKMSFGGQQQQQLGSVMARPGMMGPAGQLSMLSSQDAAHLNTQKLVSQSIPSGSSISTISPQLSGLPHNEQSTVVQGNISQQPLLKQMQAGMPSQLVQQHSHIQQQQSTVVQDNISQQQLLKQMQAGISSQSVQQQSQSVQQQSHIQQQQQRQQHHAILPQQLFPQPYRITFALQQKVSQLVQQQSHIIQQQRTQQQHAILPQQLSFPQPDHISLGRQQQVSQLVQQQAQLGTVQQQQAALLLQQQQHLHQLQLQQQHHEQQSPHVPGFTISNFLKGSQPSMPASGTISQLICEIQDLVSQAQLHLHNKRLKQVRKALDPTDGK